MTKPLALTAVTALLALAGCGDDQVRKFGTTRAGNQTEARGLPPLSMPPLLSQRPPRVGAARAQDATEEDVAARSQETDAKPNSRRARQLAAANARAPVSRGQESLLSAAGPAAPADIRARLTSDAQLGATDTALSERILSAPPGGQGLIQLNTPGFWSRLF